MQNNFFVWLTGEKLFSWKITCRYCYPPITEVALPLHIMTFLSQRTTLRTFRTSRRNVLRPNGTITARVGPRNLRRHLCGPMRLYILCYCFYRIMLHKYNMSKKNTLYNDIQWQYEIQYVARRKAPLWTPCVLLHWALGQTGFAMEPSTRTGFTALKTEIIAPKFV